MTLSSALDDILWHKLPKLNYVLHVIAHSFLLLLQNALPINLIDSSPSCFSFLYLQLGLCNFS